MSLMPEPAPDYSSGEGLLNYTDYDSVRSDLRKKVLGAVTDSAVSENDKYLIRAVDVAYAKPDGRFSLSDQKSAILEGRTLSDKITGRWEVIDKETGKAVGKTGRKSIINVPFLTDRGTYIRNGTEYTFAKQLRLNSGIYTRVTDDSNVESQFNAIPRSGPSFRIYMEPSTSYFYMRYKGRKIPLYPVLRAMGKEHEDIEAVWGKAIADENKVLEKSPYAVNFLKSFAEKATNTQQTQPKVSLDAKAGSVVAQLLQQKTGALASSMYTDSVREGIVGEFGKIGIDPRVTLVTMGEEHSNASPNAILSATGKILRVSKGQEDSDSRDSLEFQNVWDISDFISDKISNDQNGVLRQILWKVTKKNGDASAIPTALLDKHVQHTFVSSGLAQAIEEINPLDMYDQNQRVLRLGEGAMTSVDVVPKEARGVQPTYFNYIDPVRAPECYAADMEVMTERGWVAWPDVTEEDVFACMVEGRLEYNKASQVVSYPYSGEMCGADTNAISYLVTPDHRMWTRPVREPKKDHYPKYGFEFAVDSDNEDRLHLASQDASFQSETVVKAEDTFRQQYEGQIYCATVPGGLLHVRRNNKSGFWCGNSLKIGVDMKMSRNVRRGPDKELYSKFIDARTGKEKWVGIREAARKNLAWPEFSKTTDPYVIAMAPNKGMAWVKREDVDYILPTNDDMFSDGANLVPLKSGVKGMRLLMGCLHEDTDIIIRRDGAVYKTLVGEYTWKDGDETISVNEDTLRTEWAPILGMKENTQPQQTMLMITLKSGRQVITTDNHKWVTMGPDGKLEEVLARDLRKKTPIPRTGDTSHLFGESNCTSIQLGDLKIDLTDREDGWIFGLYLAEGALRKINSKGVPNSAISIAGIEPFIQERLRAWCEKKGIRYRLKSNRRYPDGYDNIVNSRELASLFYTHCSSGSYNKKISGTLMNAGREFREGLVAGYLAGDGGVGLRRGYARVYAGTRSAYLARDFMTLLGTIGIDSTKTYSMVKGAPFYKVEVRPQHISRLPDIGHPTKDERLAKHPTWSGKKDIYWVPKYSELHKKILSCSARKEQFRHRSYVDQHTRGSLAERLTVDDCPWIGSNVMWDTVASVAEVPESDVTYDLDLGDKVFAVDAGVFVHNSKFSPQALPLVDREAPLVRTADPASGSSMERRIGRHLGAVRASRDATVKAVRKNRIDLVYSDGTTGSVDLYDNFPYARSTYIRNNAAVKAGDRVKKGDLLAHSNFTDKEGVSALGTNLRVAYWNYDGLVFEDAIVISESAAKKLKSEHMYHSKIKKEADLEISKAKFRANFPSAYNKEQLDKIDEETGMIKPGSIVRYGDPLALAISEQDPKTGGSLGRRIRSNKSVTWQKKTPGIVTDATEGKDKYYINVRTNAPMNVGDKLSIRFGGKGVISKVVKDSDMPTDPKGRKMDVIMSPLGVVSRTNPAQKIEAQLGKVAAKTGVPYVLPGFLDESMVEFAHKELQKHRLSDKEDLVDPRTGRKIPGVFTGVSYFYKMQHTSEGKGKGRSQAKYTAEDQPAKGGKSGAKHLGKMYQEALLAHGATEVLKDMKLIKGQKNDAFWRQLKLGQTPTMPKTPLVYEKFKELLRAGGVQLSEGAFSDDIFSMTNKQAVDLTGNRKITSGDTYTAKNLKPIAGGLFDPEATGSSANGDRWSYIDLPMPMPNPIMAEPLRRILGLKQAEMEDLIASGDKHLKAALDRVDVKQEKAKALNDIKHGIRSKRDDAVKKFRFLHAFETNEVKPSDFLMTRVPVLPPRFRPITSQGGMAMVADPNYLYKSLIESANDYKDTEGLPEEVRKDARRDMWDSYKALIGISDPKKDQLVQKNVKGILSSIFGKGSPKTGFFQRRVLGTNIDMSGLGVVAPNPSLKLNQAGIPEKMAWDLYEPFVIRDLVQQGVPATEAAKAVQAKNPLAYKALQSVVTKRPVILNRAPTLHKYSVMGFWPVLVKGATVQVPPAIVGPYAMDFDGDSLLTLIRVEINQEKLSEAVSISDPKGILRFETQTQEDEMHDPNTPIHIHNRTIRIEDLPRLEDTKVEKSEHMTEWDVPKGIEIYAYDKDTGEHRMFEVTKLSQHDDIDMVDVLIGTKRAYPTAITCSTDHSLVYYEPSTGEVVDGPPADALGKYVPVIKKMNSDSSTGSRKFLTIGNQVKATFDLGVFIGAMIGDGWVDVANVAYISSVYPELRDALQNTVDTSNIPQNSPSGHKTNPRVGGLGKSDSLSTKVNFHLKDRAAQDLKDMIGSGAENKTIPWQCLDCGPAHLRGILSGLLSTDGTVNIAQAKTKNVPTRNVSYETTSPYLRDGVQLLLKKLGMRSSVCVYKGTNSTVPCYKITISSLDFGKFLVDNKDFHLPHADKQAALEKFRELSTDTPPSNMEMALDVVPYPEHIFEVMSWLRPLTSITSTGMSPLRKKGAMPRVKAEEFIAAADKADWAEYATSKSLKKEDRTGMSPEKLHELFLQWKRIVSDDSIMWQPVTEVTSIGKKTCWDITVPGPLTFATASGVIVQDTAAFTVPVSDEAVSQVIDRMMPDRNLISARSGQPTYKLTNEYLQGLYLATKNPTDKQPVVFNTVEEAKKAYRMGKIAIDDPITILE